MQISLDGGMTWNDAPQGVRVVYREEMMPGEDVNGDVCFTFTNEGLITDVWTDDDENIGTSSEMISEIIDRLVEENS